MSKIKRIREHLIIEIDGVYNFRGKDYRVITATSEILETSAGLIDMTEKVYLLENIKTGVKRHISESTLKEELSKYNEVVKI